MSYETDQLKQAFTNVLQQSENRQYATESRITGLETRVQVLEEFVRKAKPYIDATVLIDPDSNNSSVNQ